MGYRWKPSASQRRAFAERMQDPSEREAYEQRKREKADKRRAGSQYDYAKAGGNYIPTKIQFDIALRAIGELDLTPQEIDACNQVVGAYTCNEKTHHDNIHIVNEFVRNGKIKF
jgi:hypothetical protein